MRLTTLILISLFLCVVPFEQSSAERRRTTQLEVLQDGAYNNKSPRLQFELGYAYFQGDMVPRDYAEAYIWFAIAAANGVEGATPAAQDTAEILKRLGIFKYVERKAHLYYKKYVSRVPKEKLPENDFTVYVNDIPYQYVAAITPLPPIEVRFEHPDPSVKTIRMQHPDDPNRSIELRANKTQRITNHEQHMKAGHPSTSVFMALDENGNKKGTVVISFVP